MTFPTLLLGLAALPRGKCLHCGPVGRARRPSLKKRALQSNADTDFPDGPKQQRTASVQLATQAIESTSGSIMWRSIAPPQP